MDFFGTPSIEGNTLTFDFSDIYAASPSTPQREVLEFQVVAKSGFLIDHFHSSESGDYSLSGKNSSVSAGNRLRLDDFTNDEWFRESTEESFRLGAAGGQKSGSWSAVFDQSITWSEELDVLLTAMLWANPAGPGGEARIDLNSVSVTKGIGSP